MAAIAKFTCRRGSKIFPSPFGNFRRFTTESQILPQEKLDDDVFKSPRDVPFMFLPHTVKKAYLVHPTQTYLPKVFDKYKWLTKTISSPGLPAGYNETSVPEHICDLFQENIKQNVAFTKGYKNKNHLRYNQERVKHNTVSNFLKIAMISNNSCAHLSSDDSSFYHESLLETHWPRNYKFFQTKFRPTYCLKTRNGLPIVEKPEVLSEEEVSTIPGPYDNYALNTYRHHIVHLRNQPGMDNAKFNPIKHCHTTLMVNTRIRTDEHFFSTAVLTSFAQLASQAQAAGILHGTELKQPLVTQTIVTNGYRIAFLVYQLNTMYLLDDKNIWNRCWYSPVLDLYERVSDERYHVFEDAVRDDNLRGIDERVYNYLISFFGKETM